MVDLSWLPEDAANQPVDPRRMADIISQMISTGLGFGGDTPSALTQLGGGVPMGAPVRPGGVGQTQLPSTLGAFTQELTQTEGPPQGTTPGATGNVMPAPGGTSNEAAQQYGAPRGEGRSHGGVDFGIPSGSVILSMAPGTVVYSGDGGDAGNMVTIDHGNGMQTKYMHLTGATVRPGDQVTAGQQIGISGETGAARGPHLHFEVWKDGENVDPTGVLAGSTTAIFGQGPPTVETGTDFKVTEWSPEEIMASQLANMVSSALGAEGVKDVSGPKSVTMSKKYTITPGAPGAVSANDGDPSGVDAFLAATRQHESGGDYRIRNQSGLSNAAGAYQFIGSTWRGLGGSTESAADASPEEQDRIARAYALQLFEQFGSWRLVAIAWYGGPGIAARAARGEDPGAPEGQGRYLDYGDTIASMMAGG